MVNLLEENPTATEYVELRKLMGWGKISPDNAQQTIDAATFTVTLREEGQLIGMLRMLGDGILYIVVADVMVHPDYTGQGLGNQLMQRAIAYIDEAADPAATVMLIPIRGRESFYERFGFVRCPNGEFGDGMIYRRRTTT